MPSSLPKNRIAIRLARPGEEEAIARLHLKSWDIPPSSLRKLTGEVRRILSKMRNRYFVAVHETDDGDGFREIKLVGALQALGFRNIGRYFSNLPRTVHEAEKKAQDELHGRPTHYLCTKISVPSEFSKEIAQLGVEDSIANELLLGALLSASAKGARVLPLTRPIRLREHLEKSDQTGLALLPDPKAFEKHFRQNHLFATYAASGGGMSDYGTGAFENYCERWQEEKRPGRPSFGTFLKETGRRHLSPPVGMHFQMSEVADKFFSELGLETGGVRPVQMVRIQPRGRPGDRSSCEMYLAMLYPDVSTSVQNLMRTGVRHRFESLLKE